MMGRRRALILAGLLTLGLSAGHPAVAAHQASPAEVDEVTVSALLADPEAYTGGPVVVVGELVGDFGRRSDGTVWTQLNGDPYAEAPLRAGGGLAGSNVGIGVRIPGDLWPGFEQPGGYRFRGPVVELTGRWRYHDPGRGGESYLDVTALELLAPPSPLEEGVRWLPLGLGLGFLAAAVLGWVFLRRGADQL